MKKCLIVVMIFVVLLFVLVDKLEDLKDQGYVCIVIGNELFYIVVVLDGKVLGVVLDVVCVVFVVMGIMDFEVLIVEYGVMIFSFQVGWVDVIMVGLFMKLECCNVVVYFQLILCDVEVLLLFKGNFKGFQVYGDIVVDLVVKLGVFGGGIEEKLVLDVGVLCDWLIVVFDL